MDKTRLAAKFKRVAEWKEYLSGTNPSQETKFVLLDLLPRYEALVKDIWQSDTVKPELESELLDLERKLESADEDARLFTAGR